MVGVKVASGVKVTLGVEVSAGGMVGMFEKSEHAIIAAPSKSPEKTRSLPAGAAGRFERIERRLCFILFLYWQNREESSKVAIDRANTKLIFRNYLERA